MACLNDIRLWQFAGCDEKETPRQRELLRGAAAWDGGQAGGGGVQPCAILGCDALIASCGPVGPQQGLLLLFSAAEGGFGQGWRRASPVSDLRAGVFPVSAFVVLDGQRCPGLLGRSAVILLCFFHEMGEDEDRNGQQREGCYEAQGEGVGVFPDPVRGTEDGVEPRVESVYGRL